MAELYNGQLYTIDGFEYDPQTCRYIILHRHEFSSGVYEHAVTMFNFYGGVPAYAESLYPMALNTSSDWLPQSTCMDGSVYYMVAGHEQGNNNHILWHNSVGAVHGVCDRLEQYPVTSMRLVPEKYYENYAKPTIWNPLQFILMGVGDWEEFPCEIICN